MEKMYEINKLFTIVDKDVKSGIKFPSVGSSPTSIDIYSPQSIILKKDCFSNIRSGFIINIPENHIGIISPAGKIAIQNNLIFPAQIIHPGYNKELTLNFCQHSVPEVYIDLNDHIAQITIIPCLSFCGQL